MFGYGEAGEQRLVVYSPTDEHGTREKLAKLVEDDDADSRKLTLAMAVS